MNSDLDFGPALERAEKAFKRAGLVRKGRFRLRVVWSRSLTTAIGRCDERIPREAFRITLSEPIIGLLSPTERETVMEETLVHEIAHAWCYHLYGRYQSHGPRFRALLARIGRIEAAAPALSFRFLLSSTKRS